MLWKLTLAGNCQLTRGTARFSFSSLAIVKPCRAGCGKNPNRRRCFRSDFYRLLPAENSQGNLEITFSSEFGSCNHPELLVGSRRGLTKPLKKWSKDAAHGLRETGNSRCKALKIRCLCEMLHWHSMASHFFRFQNKLASKITEFLVLRQPCVIRQ